MKERDFTLRLTTAFMTAGAVFENGVCTAAAPILCRYMLGFTLDHGLDNLKHWTFIKIEIIYQEE